MYHFILSNWSRCFSAILMVSCMSHQRGWWTFSAKSLKTLSRHVLRWNEYITVFMLNYANPFGRETKLKAISDFWAFLIGRQTHTSQENKDMIMTPNDHMPLFHTLWKYMLFIVKRKHIDYLRWHIVRQPVNDMLTMRELITCKLLNICITITCLLAWCLLPRVNYTWQEKKWMN